MRIGIAIIIISTIVLALIMIKASKNGEYKHNMIGLLLDSWEVLALYFALIMLGIVMIRT